MIYEKLPQKIFPLPSQFLFSASLLQLCRQIYENQCNATKNKRYAQEFTIHIPVIVKVSQVTVARDELVYISSNRVVVHDGKGGAVAAFILNWFVATPFL